MLLLLLLRLLHLLPTCDHACCVPLAGMPADQQHLLLNGYELFCENIPLAEYNVPSGCTLHLHLGAFVPIPDEDLGQEDAQAADGGCALILIQ